jgi:hypothetical protein
MDAWIMLEFEFEGRYWGAWKLIPIPSSVKRFLGKKSTGHKKETRRPVVENLSGFWGG